MQHGNTMREKLMNTVQNVQLSNLVSQLYRPGASIGDGGTASFIQHVARHGVPHGMSNHFQKGQDMVKALNNVITNQRLSSTDLSIANQLRIDLINALAANGIIIW